MEQFDPLADETEEIDPLTGLPYQPNVPRDPEDPREKLKAHLRAKLESNRDSEFMRGGQRDAGLSNLFLSAANQAGTVGGKSASNQPFQQFTDNLQQQRQGVMADDNQRVKLMQYLAEKQQAGEDTTSKLNITRQAKRDALDKDERNYKLREREVKAAEAAAGMKKTQDDAALNVPGYERTGEVRPTPNEAKDTRDANGIANNIFRGLDLLKQQMAESGSFEYGGEKGTTMARTADDLRLQAKELYNLGVLNGPDLQLMLKQIPDTESLGALLTRDSTAQAQVSATADAMKRKVEEAMKSKGYKKKGEPLTQGTGGGGATPPAKGADYDSMSDEELEALYRQRGGK